jgi:hypothetical protein
MRRHSAEPKCAVAGSLKVVARQPRIYLDTAILLDRADGKLPKELVDRFDAAVRRCDAQTVITVSHLWDIHASANAEARERAIATIERMPNLRGVVVEPARNEEPRVDAAMSNLQVEDAAPDIVLGEVPDLKAVVADGEDGFFALASAGAGMAEGRNISRRAPTSRRSASWDGTEAIIVDFIRRFVDGENPSDIVNRYSLDDEAAKSTAAFLDTLRPIEEKGRRILREALAHEGGDAANLVRVLRRTRGSPAHMGWSSTEKGEHRWYEAAKLYGPGIYVSRKLSKLRASDPARNMKSSDLADGDHVTHLPYMDFATVDKENYAAVDRLLRELIPPSSVKLYRNGDFRVLVEDLERWPDRAT